MQTDCSVSGRLHDSFTGSSLFDSVRVLLKEGCSPRVQSGSEAQQLGFGHEALDQGMVHIVRLASPSMSTSTVATPVLSTKPSR